MLTRSARSRGNGNSSKAKRPSNVAGGHSRVKSKAELLGREADKQGLSGGEDEEEADEDLGDVEEGSFDVESLHSDALDDEDHFKSKSKKRRRVSTSASKKASDGKTSPRKKRKVAIEEDEDDADESDLALGEGQEIVGIVVQAPKTGRVPPGQISKNTLSFLSELKKPECNDREWFKLHEPVYRLAESEWKAFIESFTDLLVEADPQIPHLPPKDVIRRIYRDIRFSNDKTPYKTGFSASFSRSGRKGIFAGYHIAVKPGDQSLIAAGSWCPGKNEIATIRNNLQRSSRRLRQMISEPEFEQLFGPARPHPKGLRQNIFGMDDELKVAPKGVDKTHKDIDLLKCRSFAVVYRFTDKQVLSPEFKHELAHLAKSMRPFVHCLNDLMTIQDAGSNSSEEGNADDQNDDDIDDD